jgi:hypothetical protein
MSEFRVERGRATLICHGSRIETRYLLHIDLGGRAVMVELLDRPDGLACGQSVQLVLSDGDVLNCQLLDDTSMCTIIGDGFRRRHSDPSTIGRERGA